MKANLTASNGVFCTKLETLGDAFLKYSMTLALFCNKSISKGDFFFFFCTKRKLSGGPVGVLVSSMAERYLFNPFEEWTTVMWGGNGVFTLYKNIAETV